MHEYQDACVDKLETFLRRGRRRLSQQSPGHQSSSHLLGSDSHLSELSLRSQVSYSSSQGGLDVFSQSCWQLSCLFCNWLTSNNLWWTPYSAGLAKVLRHAALVVGEICQWCRWQADSVRMLVNVLQQRLGSCIHLTKKELFRPIILLNSLPRDKHCSTKAAGNFYESKCYFLWLIFFKVLPSSGDFSAWWGRWKGSKLEYLENFSGQPREATCIISREHCRKFTSERRASIVVCCFSKKMRYL